MDGANHSGQVMEGEFECEEEETIKNIKGKIGGGFKGTQRLPFYL